MHRNRQFRKECSKYARVFLVISDQSRQVHLFALCFPDKHETGLYKKKKKKVYAFEQRTEPGEAEKCVSVGVSTALRRPDIWMITLISSFCLGHNTH